MRLALTLICGAALAGCAMPVPQKGELVPYRTLVAETKDRPYECSGYDVATQTCEMISSSRLSGNTTRFKAFGALDIGEEVLSFEVRGRARLRGDFVCAEEGSYQTRILNDIENAVITVVEDVMNQMFNALSGYCGAYYRLPDGGYLTEIIGPDGTAIPESLETSYFFDKPPKLRPLEAP